MHFPCLDAAMQQASNVSGQQATVADDTAFSVLVAEMFPTSMRLESITLLRLFGNHAQQVHAGDHAHGLSALCDHEPVDIWRSTIIRA